MAIMSKMIPLGGKELFLGGKVGSFRPKEFRILPKKIQKTKKKKKTTPFRPKFWWRDFDEVEGPLGSVGEGREGLERWRSVSDLFRFPVSWSFSVCFGWFGCFFVFFFVGRGEKPLFQTSVFRPKCVESEVGRVCEDW